jgi:hypothetical protein
MRIVVVALFYFIVALFADSSQARMEYANAPELQCQSLDPAACLKKMFGNCGEPCVLPASNGGWKSDWTLIEKAVKQNVRRRFVIIDRCDSFCALFAEWMRQAMPDRICIAPGASLGYHLVEETALVHAHWVVVQRYAVAHNQATEKWLSEHGGETDQVKRIPFTDLAAMDIWPICRSSDVELIVRK